MPARAKSSSSQVHRIAPPAAAPSRALSARRVTGTDRSGDTTGRRRARRARGRLLLALLVFVLAAGVVGLLAAWRGDRLPPEVAERLYPVAYQQQISQAARMHRLDPYLVAAVVKTESGFDPAAESPAGAVGLMQLMPDTAAWIAARDDWEGSAHPDLRDPIQNLRLGSYYLAHLLQRFDGDRQSALAAYNAGWGRVGEWLADEGKGTETLTVESIPYPETRGFVERVERFRDLYARAYPEGFE